MDQPGKIAKLRAARLILRGNLALISIAIVLQAIFHIRKYGGIFNVGASPTWFYVPPLYVLLVTAIAALYLLRHSLSLAFQLYAWVGMLCIGSLIIYSVAVFPEEFPQIVFTFHIGIFALGIVLNFRAAFSYATATTLFIALIAPRCPSFSPGQVIPHIITAYGLTLPALLVDRLIKDLQQSEEKFTTVVRESLDVILVLDSQNHTIISANHATQKSLDYKEDDLVGQSFSVLLPSGSELSDLNLTKALEEQESLIESQMFQRSNGSLCPMDLTATLIPWNELQSEAQSEGKAVLVTLRDITERKRAEEELARYREHLEELVQARTAELEVTNAQLREEITERQRAEAALRQRTHDLEERNKELDAFAHTVAHDLKNPLTSLVGFSKLLEKNHAKLVEEKLQEYLEIIAKNGRKMSNIVEELLLLSSIRKEDVEAGPLPMSSIVAEAQTRLSDAIQEHQAEIIQPESWPLAMGYGPWIEEVWTNYISNAIKYGGTPPRVELGATKQSDGYICFWVRDNGKGLSHEEQARLFTMFTRINQIRARGHGLGLSIVRRIVEKLGGEVGVESDIGEGSVFKFILPSVTLDEASATAPGSPAGVAAADGTITPITAGMVASASEVRGHTMQTSDG
jgi:PAS domain S-box-containing protein